MDLSRDGPRKGDEGSGDRLCPRIEGEAQVRERCADMLRDESNLAAGSAEIVYLPEAVQDIASALAEAAADGEPVTVSGARTGIVGGAVPVDSRRVLSLSRMSRVLEIGAPAGDRGAFARVQAGVTISALGEALGAFTWPGGRRWYYPVDPTERSAHVGGTIATNASGGRSFHYGPTRRWVNALVVVLADGRAFELRRGQVRAERGRLRWPEAFGASVLELPRLARPRSKCAAGYFVEPDADLVDIFIGSEGTLGVVAEAELGLAEEPPGVLALVCFLPPDRAGLDLVRRFKSDERLSPLSIEYFDATALALLREERASGGEDKIPELPAGAGSAVFVELAYGNESELDRAVSAVESDLAEHGCSLDDTWAGDDLAGRERMRLLRHAVPEAVNARVARRKRDCPELHKVGTDLAVPDESFERLAAIYRERLPRSGLEYVVFGHAGENHLHVNLLARTREELERAKDLHRELAREAVGLGGAVTAEHGIGRLKRELLEIQYGREGVEALRRVKEFFDPRGLLNPGVLFPPRGA